MDKIIINGGKPLYGTVSIGGMKNAALPIIFACILTKEKSVIENLPDVSDVTIALEIIKHMGATVKYINRNTVEIDTENFVGGSSPYELVSKMRGSTYLIGAELGRFGCSRVGWPGGCDFGVRPIDQHQKGFEALGATVLMGKDQVVAEAPSKLHGNSIFFDVISVGATINVMLASVLAEGLTVIENAAREPHIVDLANFFNTCGANIMGAGTSVIKIKGVEKLHGSNYTIIPDMIEAGTFMAAVAATGGKVTIDNIIPKHMEVISAKLEEMGAVIENFDESLTITSSGNLRGANIKTLPYPGFPTDMHPQFSAVLATVNGVGIVSEGIWDNRFRYIEELLKMGANINLKGTTATIVGVEKLHGCNVKAVDLRAGAAVVIAGLAAEGTTEIVGINFIKRGYADIVDKLKLLGADITEVND